MSQPTTTTIAEPARPRPSRLWIWFVVGFGIQLAVWTAWFIIAAHHPVEEVPVSSSPAK